MQSLIYSSQIRVDTIVPQLVKELKRNRGKRPIKKVPRAKSIKYLERAYYKSIFEMVSDLKKLTQKYLVPSIPSIISQAGFYKVKSDSLRSDTFSEEISRNVEFIRLSFSKIYDEQKIENMAKAQASKINLHNANELSKQFGSVLGVNPVTSEFWLPAEITAFTKQNVSLIKSIPQNYFDRIEQTVIRDVQAGKLTKDIEADIKAAYNVSDNKAALIARDQTNKFNGELNRIRQTEVGITQYEWSTSLDERVRPEHAAREGKIFNWNDPPEGGHPGSEINCRCEAIPVFE